jgi:2-polyprenyl-3-methyl-5-hydroxy-6-metoxy-1,4-benzoquinol methylase
MNRFKSAVPQGFTNPTSLPVDNSEQELWQLDNRNWWQRHPMRYDWNTPIPHEEFSKEFYVEIDKRFYDAVSLFAPWKTVPFDFLLDFDSLQAKDVLEIGCGNGSHGQLLASHAKSYTGIDLTDYAVKSTSTRMSLWGLNGSVLKMDAETMQFPDRSFDLIWSWGVIHHSANTKEILKEMNRVLRPGGRAIVMVYYRSLWSYYAAGSLLAVLRGKFPTRNEIHKSKQLATDGAIARYYTPRDWRMLTSGLFEVGSIRIYGQKEALIFLPGGKLKNLILRLTPNSFSRFLSGPCRMGSFLVSKITKS